MVDTEKNFFGPQFKAINTLFEKQMTKTLNHPNGTPKLTSGQFAILNYLYNNKHKEIYQRDLEGVFNLSRPTINGMIKRLRLAGFLDIVPSTIDRRYKQIILREDARAAMVLHRDDFEHDVMKVENKLACGMSADEQAALHRLLAKCLVNLKAD